jgi:hypothetical protein
MAGVGPFKDDLNLDDIQAKMEENTNRMSHFSYTVSLPKLIKILAQKTSNLTAPLSIDASNCGLSNIELLSSIVTSVASTTRFIYGLTVKFPAQHLYTLEERAVSALLRETLMKKIKAQKAMNITPGEAPSYETSDAAITIFFHDTVTDKDSYMRVPAVEPS